MTTATADTTSFSARLAAETSADHSGAERSPFLGALMRRTLPLSGYVDLLTQYLHVYRAIEDGADRLAADPVIAPFLSRALDRVPALEADIADLTARPEAAGKDYGPTPATEAYVARIRQVTDDPVRYVAHHYTRYLGDLSGGFAIGRIVAAAYDLKEDDGGRFAAFPEIPDPGAFKDAYRRSLDEAPWTPEQHDALIDEVHDAYRFNVEVYASLDHHAS
jgi:heme oxygenase